MKSVVYFIPASKESSEKERIDATKTIMDVAQMEKYYDAKKKVAVKIHVGEKGNVTYLRPPIIREVVQKIKNDDASPFLTETSTLYRGERSNAIDHLIHAYNHGFTYETIGAPFILADGLNGNTEIDVEIQGKLHSSVKIAREIAFADSLITVSHATGHVANALGATLKNLGMGLASRKGKMRQHSSMNPTIDPSSCTLCGQCITWCPEDTIVEKNGAAFIVQEGCIGCGECLSVCNFGAVGFDWGTESTELQKHVAEHAKGVLANKEGKAFFLNYLIDMTADCDCIGKKQSKVLPDLGILASEDPVAIDTATLDLTKEHFGKNLAEKSYPSLDAGTQVQHAQEIGMGSMNYNVETLS